LAEGVDHGYVAFRRIAAVGTLRLSRDASAGSTASAAKSCSIEGPTE
jgi:hypothetical protein